MTKNGLPYFAITTILWVFIVLFVFSHSRYNSSTRNLINDLERTSELLLLKTKEEIPDWKNEQIEMGFERIKELKEEKSNYGFYSMLFFFGAVACLAIQPKLKKDRSNQASHTTPASAPR